MTVTHATTMHQKLRACSNDSHTCNCVGSKIVQMKRWRTRVQLDCARILRWRSHTHLRFIVDTSLAVSACCDEFCARTCDASVTHCVQCARMMWWRSHAHLRCIGGASRPVYMHGRACCSDGRTRTCDAQAAHRLHYALVALSSYCKAVVHNECFRTCVKTLNENGCKFDLKQESEPTIINFLLTKKTWGIRIKLPTLRIVQVSCKHALQLIYVRCLNYHANEQLAWKQNK